MPSIIWTDYLKYRAKLRQFDLDKIEEILRYSGERYYDTITERMIAVGKHNNSLVIIPYEYNQESITQLYHTTTRQQIQFFRLKTGRFINE